MESLASREVEGDSAGGDTEKSLGGNSESSLSSPPNTGHRSLDTGHRSFDDISVGTAHHLASDSQVFTYTPYVYSRGDEKVNCLITMASANQLVMNFTFKEFIFVSIYYNYIF